MRRLGQSRRFASGPLHGFRARRRALARASRRAPRRAREEGGRCECSDFGIASTSIPASAIHSRCYGRLMSELPENFQTAPLAEVDPEIAAVLDGELRRQQDTLEMIASENFVPQAVLEAVGSVLTNKYAEGYPGRRYYGGCEEVDVAEQLAIDRAKAALRRRARQRPAPLRGAGQQRRLHGAARTRRHLPRARSRPRRPPQPRDEDQRLRHALQPSPVPRPQRRSAGRHGRGRPRLPRSTSRS